jgi:radical SAM superfamily enzyme YgiQ (UPF0313 family)
MKIALYEAADEEREGRLFYPLGLGYLASYLREKIPSLEVVIFKNIDSLLAYSPDLAGVSAVSPDYNRAVKACDEIKRGCGAAVVLGGVHITGVPGSLPPSCVAGVLGEGEETFAELVKLHLGRRTPGPSDYAEIAGLVFRDEEDLVQSARRGLISPLESLPFPSRDWEGIEPYVHWSLTSRGCPYRCAFCYSSVFWDRLRACPASYVLDELRQLIDRFDILYHTFMDDLFSADGTRLRAIAEGLKDFPRALEFTVTVRSELVTEELASILVSMGVKFAHLGLESGSNPILRALKGPTASVEGNQRALDILSDAGIRPVGSFILGCPGETVEDMDATYSFIERNLLERRLASFTVGPLVPFPGTAVWKDAAALGLIDPRNMDWGSLDIDLRWFDRERYLLLNAAVTRETFFARLDELLVLMRECHEGIGKQAPLTPRKS